MRHAACKPHSAERKRKRWQELSLFIFALQNRQGRFRRTLTCKHAQRHARCERKALRGPCLYHKAISSVIFGRGGAKRRLVGKIRKSFRAARLVALRLKPVRILDFDGIGNRLVPAWDFFLEKKQKRARCSGLPSRFILCRTCRAKAACLGGVSFCIPRAAGAAYSLSAVRQIGTRLWPCACAHRGSSKGRADAERSANAAA